MSKAKAWIGLSAFAVVLILVGGWFALIAPKHADAADLRAQTQTTETQISSLQARLRDLQQKKENLPAQTAALANIERKLPADPSLPPLIRALTAAARSAGVMLKSISPSTPSPLAAVAGSPSSAQISVIALSVATEGDYFATERFVSALEQLDRGLLVSGFTLSGGSESAPGTGGTGPARKKLSLTIQGQVFVSTAATAGGAATGTTGTATSSRPAGTTAN
jgi:Tfp pilus assembly protein PilO